MLYVNDMIGSDGAFYNEIEFKSIYGIKTNFIQYNGVIKSIKTFATKSTVNWNKRMLYPILPAHIKIYLKSEKGCKDFYNLLNMNREEPSSKVKWENEYL